MRKLATIIVCLMLASMGTAQAAEDHGGFSLEYCPTTPTPTDAKGQAPGAVTAKYGPRMTKDFKPYIGTGLAYSLPAPAEKPGDVTAGVKTGVAGQAGFSYKLSEKASVNLDYKYLYLGPEATRGGNATTPQLFGLRLGCSF